MTMKEVNVTILWNALVELGLELGMSCYCSWTYKCDYFVSIVVVLLMNIGQKLGGSKVIPVVQSSVSVQ